MKQILRFFKTYLVEFKQHFGQYLILFWGMGFLLTLVVIPILTWLASFIMRATNIPYVSYTNLGNLLVTRPLGSLILILLLFLLLFIVYCQFALQIQGVQLIQAGNISLKKVFGKVFRSFPQLNFRNFGFFIFYFLLILPFGTVAFSTELLEKIQIPAFTMEFFYRDFAHFMILVVFYAFALILGTRFIFILPLTILKGLKVREALRKSLTLTKGFKRFFRLFLTFAAINLSTWIAAQIIYWVSYLLQTQLDKTGAALIMAVVFMVVIELTGLITHTIASMLLFSVLLREIGLKPTERANDKVHKSGKHSRLPKMFVGAILALAVAFILLANWAYMSSLVFRRPLTISHRGVDDENGVQNTIPALERTAKEKPDYVEMDIQETADHQFVVMHDPNLSALAGINKKVENMTLAELTNLSVHEHGMTAKIPSFDDYFAAAQRLQQKLLIEIKVNPKDSSDLTEIFLKKYGKQILANGDKVHSLDYDTVSKIKKEDSKIFISFILPVNFIFPTSSADAYTMEATTLDNGFVDRAHSQNQQVYAWTVNDPATMRKMMLTDVDGIITDNLNDLKEEIQDFATHPSYAQRLRILFDEFSVPTHQVKN